MNSQRYDFGVYCLGLSLLLALTLFGFALSIAVLIVYAALGVFYFTAGLRQVDVGGRDKLVESLLLLLLWPLALPFYLKRDRLEFDEDEDPRLLSLISRFGGRIDASSGIEFDEAARTAVVFADLLEEWNPINVSVENFSKIVGSPTRTEDGVLEYEFDNGWDGDLWRFGVSGGYIVSVEHVALD